ncbi:MAG: hypothetical protein EXS31_09070 [Pedosphaera sp.]|nr:hypothetical protein [Pedosphaera sp.]
MKKLLTTLLNICLALLLVDAGVSLLDDSLILFAGLYILAPIRGMLAFFALFTGLFLYVLTGVTPMIPKRYFLPLALFGPAAMLAAIPFSIFHYDQLQKIAWALSWCEVLLSLCILVWLRGTLSIRWPLVREDQLGDRAFGWLNSAGFVAVNLFILLPGVLCYLAFCGSLAVEHFSGGFLSLRTDSLVMRAVKYVRDDGKTIQLIPMMHIGEPDFYKQITSSFPTNSVILMEGVTDRKNLLQEKLSYGRVAKSLGLTEQKEEFTPARGRPRMADVDIEQFSARSIEILKLMTRIHAEGLSLDVILKLMEKSKDPELTREIWEDLLDKRNAHLLKEIEEELRKSDIIVVPWGAAHMRGIGEGIQTSGFRPSDTQEYKILRFQTVWNGLRGRK